MPSFTASSITVARLIPGSVLRVVGEMMVPRSTNRKLAALVFLIGEVVVHPAAVLHLRVDALRRHVPDGRRDQVSAAAHFLGPQIPAERKRVNANRARTEAGLAPLVRGGCQAGVTRDLARCDELDQAQLAAVRQERRVMGDQLAGDVREPVFRFVDRKPHVVQRPK
jgi:hypothetical protein